MGGFKQTTDHPSVLPLVWWVVIITILFLIGFVQSLSPYDGELIYRKAVVVSVVHPLAAGESSKHHKDVISKALRLFLEKEGLEVITSPVLEDIPIAIDDNVAGSMVTLNSKDLLYMARSVPADFLLISTYSVSEKELQLIFSLYDIEEGIACATITRAKPIDLTFDKLIDEVVDELLLSIKHKLARYSPLQADPTMKPVPAENARVSGPPPILSQPLPEDAKRIEIAVGAAPFLPIGRTSDYFKIGLCTVLHGSYRFDIGSLGLSAGLLTGTYLFRAEGLSGTASTLLLPIGPLIGIVHRYGSAIDLYTQLSGGMAVMSMVPSGLDNRLSKILPFAIAAVGLRFGFGTNLGLIAETNFTAFFETADEGLSPLLGFTPAMYLRFRL